ncbi:MAG: aromatic amino acid hydroxylase, partial [Chthoniobacterales bacterium]
DRIPRIEEMNEILGKIGWGCVAVDGFIPPAAFMEFQAYRVLVIACDMRQINHIEYTPAPDIVHEAAGHAPIIVDQEYADYLQRFGEVGAKAMSSKKDFELYEAIRHLSILKELPKPEPRELAEATKLVEERQKNLGTPSEMALLSRLHWWTVEYGLIGPLEQPKIYGAGLLSSIGESVSCLEPKVKKQPYSLGAAETAFDITTKQPQLFVTHDFSQLAEVLEQFASRMAFRVGGIEGIRKAIDSHNTGTCEYDSGLEVSGTFTEVLTSPNDEPIYLRTTGPTALAVAGKELAGHGIAYHQEGFGSPIGNWKETALSEGKSAKLEFESGVIVEGKVEKLLRRDGKLLLITFFDCTAKFGERLLFDPAWGSYDMAVGTRIVSVFNGAADKDAYNQVALIPKERTIKNPSDAERRKLENLYQQVRDIRTRRAGTERLGEIWETQQAEHPRDWLLSMEIYEILDDLDEQPALKTKVASFLEQRRAADKEIATLVEWGFKLVTYHQEEARASSKALSSRA